MCMVIYIASRRPLPLVPWQPDARAFNVTALTEHEEPVRRHFTLPNICCAGSHTQCGCGFNEGRGYQGDDNTASVASSARLARFVREHGVGQIYSCWSGDEGQAREFERSISPEALVADDFLFRERELLTMEHEPV